MLVCFFSNVLSGPIPEALCALKELKVLVLYKNQLNGEREDEIGAIFLAQDVSRRFLGRA